jgi:molybdopterin synthase sulfur carrier subunit
VTSATAPTVTVRFWAGARAAAGVTEEQVEAATLEEALQQVRRERDGRFAGVLAVCSYVVSERPVGRTPHQAVTLVDGDIVEVLPPFAGGAEPVAHDVHTAPPPHALPAWRPPMLSALVGLLLMIGAAVGPAYLWVGVGLAQLLLVASWHRALGATDALGGITIGALLIVVADVAVAGDDGVVSYGPISVILGVGYLAAVVQQLARRDGRPDLTLSLAATVSLATIGALGAGWAINPRLADGDSLTLVAATAVTAAAVGRLAPGLRGAMVGPLVAGTAAGALVGLAVEQVGAGLGAAIGCAAAFTAALAAVGQLRVSSREAGWPAGAVWPVLLAAPLVYLVLRFAGH